MRFRICEISTLEILYLNIHGYSSHPYIEPPPRFLYYQDIDVTKLITGKKLLTRRLVYLIEKYRKSATGFSGFRTFMKNFNICDNKNVNSASVIHTYRKTRKQIRDKLRAKAHAINKDMIEYTYNRVQQQWKIPKNIILSSKLIQGIDFPLSQALEHRNDQPLVKVDYVQRGIGRVSLIRTFEIIQFIRPCDPCEKILRPIKPGVQPTITPREENQLRCNISKRLLRLCKTSRCRTRQECREKIVLTSANRFHHEPVKENMFKEANRRERKEESTNNKNMKDFMIDESFKELGGCKSCVSENKKNADRYLRLIGELYDSYEQLVQQCKKHPAALERIYDFGDVLNTYREVKRFDEQKLTNLLEYEEIARQRVKSLLRQCGMDMELTYKVFRDKTGRLFSRIR